MMDDPVEEQSMFRKIEAWTLEWDLHIWYGFISLIALCVLLYIVDKEFSKTVYLNAQIVVLRDESRMLRLRNQDLVNEIENQRQVYLANTILPKVQTDPVDKAANKVSEKINKVQDVLIDKASQPQTKVIKTTETTLVPTPTVVNKELNTMMLQSYCSTVPDSPSCITGKKK